jgi:DNA polymerase-3 subunit alpha
VQQDERGVKIIADSIDSLQEAREKYTESVKMKLESAKLSRKQLEKVKKVLYQYHGSCPILLTLHFQGKGEVDIEVIRDLTIRPCRELTDQVEEILHYKALSFHKKAIALAPRKKRWNNQKST